MFLENTIKCKKVFGDSVYVSSDSKKILDQAIKVGAIPILRGENLCGDTPNIPVYQHALKVMPDDVQGIVAVQANSPTIDIEIIKEIKKLMEEGKKEVMTMHEDGTIYGSVWAISKNKLLNYGDPYKPQPEIKILDTSVDIHNQEDYNMVIKQSYGK